MTPAPSSIDMSSSPSTFTPCTPPDSYRRYSDAIKAFTAQGMKSAMDDMNDESRVMSEGRQSARDWAFDDEDPIDRHVRLYLNPRLVDNGKNGGIIHSSPILGASFGERLDMGQSRRLEVQQEDQEMLDEEEQDATMLYGQGSKLAQPYPQRPFRPGLLHFNRSSRGSVPSLCHSTRPGTYAPSSMSSQDTPFGYDSDPRVESSSRYTFGFDFGARIDGETPGSVMSYTSEQSFEGMKSEDWCSLYGKEGTSQRQPSWKGEGSSGKKSNAGAIDVFGQEFSLAATTTRSSLSSTATAFVPEGTVSPGTVSSFPNGSPSQLSPQAFQGPSPGSAKRPSLTRPRPRAYPYPPPPELAQSRNNRESSLGPIGEQTEPKIAPADVARLAHLAALGLSSPSKDEEEWLAGRSVSETMVWKAGTKCQRGRVVRAGR